MTCDETDTPTSDAPAGLLPMIQFKIRTPNNTLINCTMRMNKPMIKCFERYLERADTNLENVRFLYDGITVYPMDTPLFLCMEDGDIIDAIHLIL